MNTRDRHPNARLGKVLCDEPNSSSQASLALLNAELWRQDPTTYHRKRWSEFRDKVFKKILAEKGDVVCHYCQMPGLIVNGDDPELKKHGRKKLATLDHIVATSKGGALYDESNVVPSCYPCNTKKGDKDEYHPKIFRPKKSATPRS